MRAGCALLLGVACRPVLAPRVTAPAQDPSDAWEDVLVGVVTDDGRVDYDLLEERRAALDDFVAWIARPRRVERSNTQHAFWLNAYNALVLYAVLEDGRPASVRDVEGWLPWPGSGLFFERAFLVQGAPTSLHEIEHERLRGRVMDYRDHAALNCASASCPPLRAELYDAAGVEAQLKDQMQVWLRDPARGVVVQEDHVELSALFDWYAWDFSFLNAGDDPCTVAARFTAPEISRALHRLAERGCPRTFRPYDWSLNDASGLGHPDRRRRERSHARGARVAEDSDI